MEIESLGAAIERLPERTRYVLIRRYGLDEHDSSTLAELSEELGISRERARQLQREAERMLKTASTVMPSVRLLSGCLRFSRILHQG